MMNRQIENKIVKIIKITFDLRAALPLIIGSGESEYSDVEILKDNKDNPYIPGTAIAGVMRHYTKNDDVFRDDKLSPIYTYDCEIKNYKISVRDGVELDDDKVSKNTAKYDYEIIEDGAEFNVRLDLIIREKNQNGDPKYPKEKEICQCVKKFIWGIYNGEIYIGAKSKRGFGRVELIEGTLKINDEEYNKYKEFKYDLTYDVLKVKLHLRGGIMIRKYNDNPEGADFIHLKSGGKSIIPGTTWSGAIRHRTEDIFKSLGKYNEAIERVFGSKMSSSEDQGHASLVIFEESTINGGGALPQTRVKIDRFTGGAVDSALYTEEPHYIGDTTLVIKYPKDKNYIVGLLLPALEDLCRGYLAIGGETSIGRGIFENGEIELNGKPLLNKDFYYGEVLKEADKSC